MKSSPERGVDHPNSRWVSLLWDGLRFDRSDWVEEALARGISPNIKDKAGVPAVHVAAYLNRTRAVDLLARSGARYPNVESHYDMAQYNDVAPKGSLDAPYGPVSCAMSHNNLAMFRALMKMESSWDEGAESRKSEAWNYLPDLVFMSADSDIFVELAMERAIKDLGWEQKPDAELESFRRALGAITQSVTRYELPLTFAHMDERLPQAGSVREPDHPAIKRVFVRAPGGTISNQQPADHEFVDVNAETGSDSSYYILRARPGDTALVEAFERQRYDDGGVESDVNFVLFYCDKKADMDRFVASRAPAERVARYIEAVYVNDIQTVNTCLEQGLDMDLSLWTSKNAAAHALAVGFPDVLDALLQSSVDLEHYLRTMEPLNENRASAVGFAIKGSEHYEEFEDMACYLIRNGYDFDTPDANGVTPLQCAVTLKSGPVNAIQALLDAGADTKFLEEGAPGHISPKDMSPKAVQAINAWRARAAIGRAIAQAADKPQMQP